MCCGTRALKKPWYGQPPLALYYEFMQEFMRRLAWLTTLGIIVLAIAGIGWTYWMSAVRTEQLLATAVGTVWLNFALQLTLIGIALALAFRFLTTDRKRRAEQARSEHLAEIALLASGLAHEVRNHLHALQSRVGLLRKSLAGNESALQRIERLDEIADGMEQLLTNFLTLARPASSELEGVNPAELIREVVEFERVDLERLKRALLNIVVNARQAMPNGGNLRVSCCRGRDGVRISVEDDGDGIPADVLPRVFESYFTTKPDGSGLGLAIVRRTVEDFGGHVSCVSVPGKGTTMTIQLPDGRDRIAFRSPEGRKGTVATAGVGR
jgi:signal transduction histidine kinase